MIITIVGGTGKMGQWFTQFFENRGHKVICVGRKTAIGYMEGCGIADIVIVTVPIRHTEATIKVIAPYLKDGALLTDFTSVKTLPLKAMMQYTKRSVEVTGIHPVFGPAVPSIKNQNIIVIKTNKTGKKTKYLLDMFREAGGRIHYMSAKEHDQYMAVCQGLTHLSEVAFNGTIKSLGMKTADVADYASPVSYVKLILGARILSQDKELYSDIINQNPEFPKVLDKYLKSLIAIKKSLKKYENYFEDTSNFLGEKYKKKMNEKSNKVVEISKEDDHDDNIPAK
jgi:prephenate dehydrogenase